jgi:hypothetical protein
MRFGVGKEKNILTAATYTGKKCLVKELLHQRMDPNQGSA